MLLLVALIFVAVIFGNEWTKETHVEQGVMTEKETGNTLSTGEAVRRWDLHELLTMPQHEAKAALEMMYSFPMVLDDSDPSSVTWLKLHAFTVENSAGSDSLVAFTLFGLKELSTYGLKELALKVDATGTYYRIDEKDWERPAGMQRRLGKISHGTSPFSVNSPQTSSSFQTTYHSVPHDTMGSMTIG